MTAHPPAVCAYVVNPYGLPKGGYVLSSHRPSGWALPAGKLEPGESHGVAAARELLEETGVTALAAHEVFSEVLNGRVVPTYQITIWAAPLAVYEKLLTDEGYLAPGEAHAARFVNTLVLLERGPYAGYNLRALKAIARSSPKVAAVSYQVANGVEHIIVEML